MKYQHMLVDISAYRTYLWSLDLKARRVLEVGVGTGRLTQIILERHTRSILGYEIEPNMCTMIQSKIVTIIYQDFKEADLSFLRNSDYCIISNPPYGLLPYIREVIDTYEVKDCILMVPESKLSWFPDFQTVFTLNERAFMPITDPCTHHVIQKGFKRELKKR